LPKQLFEFVVGEVQPQIDDIEAQKEGLLPGLVKKAGDEVLYKLTRVNEKLEEIMTKYRQNQAAAASMFEKRKKDMRRTAAVPTLPASVGVKTPIIIPPNKMTGVMSERNAFRFSAVSSHVPADYPYGVYPCREGLVKEDFRARHGFSSPHSAQS
jgi:hypothetical protein